MNIRIVEERWGVNHRTGSRSSSQTEEKIFEPVVGATLNMPIGRRKFIVDASDDIAIIIYVDHNTYTVCENGEPVVGHAYDDYMVAGDFVSQTLCMKFTIQ